jgi:type IV secretion system protein VirD4
MIFKIFNVIFKLILVGLAACLCFYISAALFASLIIPGKDLTDIPGIYFLFVSVGSWIKANWALLNFSSAYVVVAGRPAVTYLLFKFFGSIVGVFSIGLFILIYKWHTIVSAKIVKPKEKVHGDAKWAGHSEIEKAGLRAKEGMLLGVDDSGYYVAGGFQHTLLFAPTGSGKGVGFVIPNLLFWEHSCIVHDIKLENHGLTSGWRTSVGHKCYVWAPADPDGITNCYNPIDWVSTKAGQMVDDVQKIASLILPKQEFWENEARSLFVGVILYLIADPTKKSSFGEAVRTLRSDDVAYNLAVVLDTLGKQIHPVSYMNLAAFLQKADKERSGVISTLNSALELWSNPLIDTATATSDFNIQKFKQEKTTVYVGLTPDNLKRLQPLMQIFYQQATEFLSRKMPTKDDPYGVMFILDEFPTLGKMDTFMSGIAYFRGYHVRLFLIVQDTQQLKGIYEESGMNSFLSNSTFRVTFAANNVDTANLISQLCGNKTVKQESYSRGKYLFSMSGGNSNVNVSEVQRALLLPQEVISLPRDEQILLIEATPPIKSKKIFYYKDSFFTKRLMKPTIIPTQEPYMPSAPE